MRCGGQTGDHATGRTTRDRCPGCRGRSSRLSHRGSRPALPRPGSVAYYSRVFSRALRERLQLVFVDLRHFAVSDPAFSPDQISIDMYAADIERFRQELGLGDIIVIGHSVHATIALEYARRYPAHVRGVVAIGSVPQGMDDDDVALTSNWAGGIRGTPCAQGSEEGGAHARAPIEPVDRGALRPGVRGERAVALVRHDL